MNKSITHILDGREDRFKKQVEILKKFQNTLISFTVNTPGVEKNNEKIREIFIREEKVIEKILEENKISILYKNTDLYKSSGPEGFISVDSKAKKVKKLAIEIEEKTAIGRLFDIDVLDFKGEKISRRDLNKPSRKCIICGEDARLCVRSRKHKIEEVVDKFYSIFEKNQ
jgi:holo-ACP synthase